MPNIKIVCNLYVGLFVALGFCVLVIVSMGDPDCLLDEKTERLQVAFVADVTATNIKNINPVFAEKCKDILTALNSLHKGTEFALTTHANWEKSALPPEIRAGHSLPEGCYMRNVNFTTDVDLIVKTVKSIKEIDSWSKPPEENSLSAVSFTVTDLSIGWINGSKDENGRNVHKFIILLTDQFSIFKLNNPGKRHEFWGNGSDTCVTSRPPSREKVADILKTRNIKLIGLYVGIENNTLHQYINFFAQNEIPHKWGYFHDYRYLNALIAKHIKEKVQEHLVCSWVEPMGYNSLGL